MSGASRRVGAGGWFRLLPVRRLALGATMLLLGVGFFALGNEVTEGETHALDTYWLHAAQALRQAHPWLADVMRDLSALGSKVVLALVTAAAAGYLWLLAARREAVLLVASVSLGSSLITVFKGNFGRMRPSAEFAQMTVEGLSFPSGHSSAAAIVFLTVAALLADTRQRAAERIYVLGVSAVVTLLVGISRVVLGVHWATDVLGGWAMGAGWALLGLLVLRAMGGEHAERAGRRRG